jgi:DNA-binding transcriptional ArsR family regulator
LRHPPRHQLPANDGRHEPERLRVSAEALPRLASRQPRRVAVVQHHGDPVRRREALANPPAPARRLIDTVKNGSLAGLLVSGVRPAGPRATQQLRLGSTDVDAMAADYIEGGQPIYELAAKYGVHRVTVSQHLRSRGLTLGRQPLNEAEVRRAKELRGRRLTFKATGETLGRGTTTARAAVSRNDQPSTPPSRSDG